MKKIILLIAFISIAGMNTISADKPTRLAEKIENMETGEVTIRCTKKGTSCAIHYF